MKISAIIAALLLLVTACTPKAEVPGSLDAPDNLIATQTGLNSVRLLWEVSVRTYDGAVVERAYEDGAFEKMASLAKDVLIYNDKSLSEEGLYKYRVALLRGSEMSPYAEVSFPYSRIPAPTDAKAEKTADGLVLTWTDNCTGEDAYLVRRKVGNGSMTDWKTLPANTGTVTDPDVGLGSYDYEICALVSQERSAYASVHYEKLSTPVLRTDAVSKSWYMVYVPMTLVSDGGYDCEAGICWKNDGSSGATVDDNVYTYQYKVSTGDNCFGSATWLEYGKTYSIRPWVKYDGGIEYFSEVSGRLEDNPSALTASWTEISSEYSMPSSIKLYETSTKVTGRTVNAWYAIADMSAGDLELRTVMTSSLTKPSAVVKNAMISGDVQLIVNGGYFDSSQSLSYVMDRGMEKASGVKAVTRTFYDSDRNNVSRSYSLTRGAFGVNSSQEPSVSWLYGSKDWAYDRPLPVYNSGAAITASSDFPSQKSTWDVYSAIGGGPVILYDGRLPFDYLLTKDKGNGGRYVGNPEMLPDDIFGPSVRPPRTAVGCTADGKIVLMVVDGRDAGGSQGVTLDELARLMKGVGCTYALNLDGGGSTVMCATPSAQILNVPSDPAGGAGTHGAERAVKTFVAIVRK